MHRFLTLSLLTPLAAALWVATQARATADADPHTKRPNLVIFLADDLGWADCETYGGKDVPMPNLRRLAASGMTFTHAFVASPSCAPSRAALLTGLYPMRNGAMLNHARPRPDVRKWPAYFRDLGYDTAAIGKTAHYVQAREYGFDHASHFNYHEDDCVEAAVRWLAERARAAAPGPGRKPLCLIVGTNWPHVPWPRRSPVDPDAVGLPPTLVDTPETRRARARYAKAVGFVDRDLGLVLDAARTHLGPDTLFVFSGDHGAQFPFGKWNAYDAGVRTPLVVAWPGRVTPGTTTDAMVSWVDLLPTAVEACGGEVPPGLDGRSFLPVLLGRARDHRDKVFVTHSADANPRQEMNRYPIRAVRTRDWKYVRKLDLDAEHHTHVDKGNAGADGRNYFDSWVARAATDPAAAAVVRRYHKRPAEELYDLAADPWELRNLAAQPRHAARLAEMRTELDRWMTAQGDHGMETERALFNAKRPGGAPDQSSSSSQSSSETSDREGPLIHVSMSSRPSWIQGWTEAAIQVPKRASDQPQNGIAGSRFRK